MVQLETPVTEDQQYYQFLWILSGDPTRDRWLGEQLREALTREVIPTIHKWFDPEAYADAIEHPLDRHFPRMHPPAATAMALIEAGQSEQLRQSLARLPPDQTEIRIFLEAELRAQSPETPHTAIETG
jgi:hypothetical protein